MIRLIIVFARRLTASSEDWEGRRALHRERAEIVDKFVSQFELEVRDWGETHADYPREEVTIQAEASSTEAVDALLNQARMTVRDGDLLDVRVTLPNGREISIRRQLQTQMGGAAPPEGGGRGYRSRGLGLGDADDASDISNGGSVDDHAATANGGGRRAKPPKKNGGGRREKRPSRNGGGQKAKPPAPPAGNGGGPHDDIAMANGGDPPNDHAMANGGGPTVGGGGGGSRRFVRRQPRRLVSTGFAEPRKRMMPLTAKEPLKKRTSYVFWVEVAEQPIAGSIETEHVELIPEEALDEGAEFKVAVFAFPDELVISDKRSIGTFRYRRDGRLVVWQQPGGKQRKGKLDEPDVEFRMFFPVRTA